MPVKSNCKMWIFKEDEEKFINKSELEDYINIGWKSGRSNILKQKMNKINLNKIWIFKNQKSKRIYENELDIYKKEGWELGQTLQHRKKNSIENKGRIWINNLLIEKLVKEIDLEYYMNNNWIIGKLKSHNNKLSISLKKKYENGFINPNTGNHILKNKNYEEIMGPEKANKVKKERRLKRLEQIGENFNKYIAYNKKASEFFKELDIFLNLKNSRYATINEGELFINELAYSLDYINFQKKLIIEWDEDYHFDKEGNLRKKDIERERNIREYFPDFKFIRIKESNFLISKKPKNINYEKCLNFIKETIL